MTEHALLYSNRRQQKAPEDTITRNPKLEDTITRNLKPGMKIWIIKENGDEGVYTFKSYDKQRRELVCQVSDGFYRIPTYAIKEIRFEKEEVETLEAVSVRKRKDIMEHIKKTLEGLQIGDVIVYFSDPGNARIGRFVSFDNKSEIVKVWRRGVVEEFHYGGLDLLGVISVYSSADLDSNAFNDYLRRGRVPQRNE